MAINKITAPGSSTPSAFWSGAINELNNLKMFINPGDKIVNGYVKKGFIANIGGVLFSADSDTQISGTEAGSLAVKFTVSGNIATATYVSSLTGVSWNDTYNGFYDSSNNLYITDYIYAGDCVYSAYPSLGYNHMINTVKTYYDAINITIPQSGMWRIRCTRYADNGNNIMYTKFKKNGTDYDTEIETTGSTTQVVITKDLLFTKNDIVTISIGDRSQTGNGMAYISGIELRNALIGARSL